MSLIEWNDSFSVGIPSIDEQHMKLVNILNALQTAVDGGEADAVLNEIFEGLVTYTEKHFAYEEELFAAHHYPQGEAHSREHTVLRDQAMTLRKRFEAGEGYVSDSLIDFLKLWLNEHIQGSDKRYSDYLIEQGVR
jgi:hemerythrin